MQKGCLYMLAVCEQTAKFQIYTAFEITSFGQE